MHTHIAESLAPQNQLQICHRHGLGRTITAVFLLFAGLFVSAPSQSHAQEIGASTPSFSCADAKTATEKVICEDSSLTQRDAVMVRLYAELKKAGVGKAVLARQRKWIKSRNACENSAPCLEKIYDKRIADLARAANLTKNLAGTYAFLETQFEGSLWVAPLMDGTLSGHIITVNEASTHSCTLAFKGAKSGGDSTWTWLAPIEDLTSTERCTILIQPALSTAGAHKIKITRTSGCNHFCGVSGDFAGSYRKVAAKAATKPKRKRKTKKSRRKAKKRKR